jgi:hypothetical protein
MGTHNHLHASEHVNGTDDIQDASTSVKGLMTAANWNKLNGIEAGADVTDGTNVAAAGATMDADTSLVGNGYFLDEDNMASNDATKVPSQQSVKAYVDSAVVGLYDHKGAYDASLNSPDLDTSPSGILKGDAYTVSVAGNFFTEAVEVGDVLIADQDDPTLLTHWTRVNKNISFGTSAGTACEGNDSRLSDSRTPTTHASTHVSGGGDSIKLDDLATPDDNTDLDVSTSAHGLCPKAPNDATKFLDGSGSFSYPQQLETAAGATPVDTDVSTWANDTHGFVVGTGGRVWLAFKNATDVYYVELTAL